MACAWSAVGMRCGATRTLRCLFGTCEVEGLGLGEEALYGERGRGPGLGQVALEGAGEARVGDQSGVAAADGPGGGRGVGERGVAQAVAAGDDVVGARGGGDVDDRGVDGAVDGPGVSRCSASVCRTVCDGVDGHARWRLRDGQRTGHVLAAVGERGQVGVGEGEGDDLLALHGVLEVVQPLLGVRLALARDGVVAVLGLRPRSPGHGVDGGEQVGVDHPGDRKVLAERRRAAGAGRREPAPWPARRRGRRASDPRRIGRAVRWEEEISGQR